MGGDRSSLAPIILENPASLICQEKPAGDPTKITILQIHSYTYCYNHHHVFIVSIAIVLQLLLPIIWLNQQKTPVGLCFHSAFTRWLALYHAHN